ncbi:MAG: polysaccharide biosynthesis tyrosine autokinase [bacterium]
MAENEIQPAAPPPYVGQQVEFGEEEVFSVRSLQDIFFRHLWSFIAVVAAVAVVGLWFMYKDPPIYQARSQVKVEEKKQVFSIQEFTDVEKVTSDFYRTQVELLKSRELCRLIIDLLDLEDVKEFADPDEQPFVYLFQQKPANDDRVAAAVLSITDAIRKRITGPTVPIPQVELSERMTSLVNTYLKRLTVEPNRQTPQLINVFFEARSPFIAATAANVHARSYILQSGRSNAAYTEDYVRSLQAQTAETNKQIQAHSERIVQFKKDHNLFEIGDPASDRSIQDIDDRLTRVRTSLAVTADDRRKAEAEYAAIFEPGHIGDSLYLREEALVSPLLQTLISKRAEAEQEWILIRTRYLKRNPKYMGAESQMEALDEQIADEKYSIVERLEASVRETTQREEELLTQEAELIQEKYLRETEIEEIHQLERERQSLIAQYERLMEDLQNAQASIEARKDAGERTFEIVDYAEIPLKPINRDLVGSMLMTLLAALGAGLCAVLFMEYQDNTIRTPAEVERFTGVPMLGCIPDYDEAPELPSLRAPEEGRLSAPTPEAFVALRTAVLFSAMQTQSQVLMVTSCLPGEGKSTVAVNLAFALARSGKKTAVVDCDLRTPGLHAMFGEFREPGFVDLLFQTADADEVVHETEVPNAYLVSAGSQVDRPADVLASDMPERALEELRTVCDFIVLDAPPVLVVPDASILSGFCDRTIMVVSCGKTARDAVNTGIDHIRTAGGEIFGVVLNRVPKRERRAYRQHGYGYAYGYGYTQASESNA